METLWVESEAPEARPVFPPSSFFNLPASVSMASLLWHASVCSTPLRPLLEFLQITQTYIVHVDFIKVKEEP